MLINYSPPKPKRHYINPPMSALEADKTNAGSSNDQLQA